LPAAPLRPESRGRLRSLREPPARDGARARDAPRAAGADRGLPQLLVRHRALEQPRGAAQPARVRAAGPRALPPRPSLPPPPPVAPDHSPKPRDASPGPDPDARAAIDRRNAEALFPRFA